MAGLELTGEVDGERYVVLSSSDLFLENMKDVYEWYVGGKAPKDWINYFRRTELSLFSDINRIIEMNSKLA